MSPCPAQPATDAKSTPLRPRSTGFYSAVWNAECSSTGREVPMALRPLRNAMISFGLVSIPVRFYSATKSEDIHFNLLHASCGTRVNRKWWCPQHEKIVDSDELIRGYAATKHKKVTYSDEEMEALETDDNRALDITEFVDLSEIDPVFYEKA